MSNNKKLKYAKEGNIIVVDEHKIVQYEGSENKGYCRYVVYKTYDNFSIIYRITLTKTMSSKNYFPVKNYSLNNPIGFVVWIEPYSISNDLVVDIKKISLEPEQIENVKWSILMNKTRRKRLEAAIFKGEKIYNVPKNGL